MKSRGFKGGVCEEEGPTKWKILRRLGIVSNLVVF